MSLSDSENLPADEKMVEANEEQFNGSTFFPFNNKTKSFLQSAYVDGARLTAVKNRTM